VNKAINAWGCSVLHVRKSDQGEWQLVLDSSYNRRITAATPMRLSGPAAGSPLLQTRADPTGREVLGTMNNCGNGFTPWGTYLTCEENFNGNFGRTDPARGDTRTAAQKRYGLPAGPSPFGWERHHDRFDYTKEPNEANRFGWIVEIDPFDPQSTPVKRTALGRFKHESASWHLSRDGRVVVYMGDDQADDYIYKFVSDQPYRPGQPQANRNLLDAGRLYVARFDAGKDGSGRGEWLLLDKTLNPVLRSDDRFADQAEVLIHARLAADQLRATPMDRPEWVSVNPQTGEVYCTLTNNAQRATANAANPRTQNIYGHIIRWREDHGDAASTTFEWDLFALAGNPTLSQTRETPRAGSANINAANTFNSPDGLAFDAHGRLWIETDGNYSNSGDFANQGNNCLLCADPQSREIRRFLVGPKACEVTGIAFTPDHRTMFVNIQHPGETGPGASHWPDGGQSLPRSATVVIRKKDGGLIGT
jgi:secreted PhoX family phosphatase